MQPKHICLGRGGKTVGEKKELVKRLIQPNKYLWVQKAFHHIFPTSSKKNVLWCTWLQFYLGNVVQTWPKTTVGFVNWGPSGITKTKCDKGLSVV